MQRRGSRDGRSTPGWRPRIALHAGYLRPVVLGR